MGLWIAQGEVVDQLKRLFGDTHVYLKMPMTFEGHMHLGSHPDMHLCRIGETLFCSPMLWTQIADVAEGIYAGNMKIGAKNPCSPYPADIGYHIVEVDGKVYCKNPDEAVAAHIVDQHLQHVAVKQGYVQCSTIVLGQSAVITEDENLKRVMTAQGLDVLLIRKGYVGLSGYDYGFIGGCAGAFNRQLLFNGCIEKHPDFSAIHCFLKTYGYTWYSLNPTPLEDCGGIVYLPDPIRGQYK
ncbi:hypothetical protein KHM83_03140 [Fusibacter paucivorans]|uniref:DUF6873 domain-containing protein n=1 Tax=Fusibacter paucivorans TaxID=76009 RepID=A0ABS5PMS9_9FIRM|nr:hypothetical protein [Fusibacter paucivorans]MBS7525666.1 hypothetical protein [Fusibacter paucivorans]